MAHHFEVCYAFPHPSPTLLAFSSPANDFIDVRNLPSLLQISVSEGTNVLERAVPGRKGPGQFCQHSSSVKRPRANKIWRIPSGFRFTLLRYRLPALKANWHDSPMSHRYPKYNLQAASLIGEESEQPPPSSCYVFGQHSQRSQQIFGTHAV